MSKANDPNNLKAIENVMVDALVVGVCVDGTKVVKNWQTMVSVCGLFADGSCCGSRCVPGAGRRSTSRYTIYIIHARARMQRIKKHLLKGNACKHIRGKHGRGQRQVEGQKNSFFFFFFSALPYLCRKFHLPIAV